MKERRLKYEYYEFRFPQWGVPWRVPDAQLRLEDMERRRWKIVWMCNEFILLRRKIIIEAPKQ